MYSKSMAPAELLNLDEESRFIIRTDPHCHILPGVDDGSRSLEMSLNMARRAVGFGFQTMVATPHGCHPALKCELPPKLLRKRVAELNEAIVAAHIPLTVLPGTEILLNDKVPAMYESGLLMSWADQNQYVLIELGFHQCNDCVWDVLQYFIDRNLTPIIGHPERYTWLPGKPETVRRLAELGCYFQINVMSINGLWGQEAQRMAFELMKFAPRWMVGTDSHSDADKFWGIEEVRLALRERGLWRGDGEPRLTESVRVASAFDG